MLKERPTVPDVLPLVNAYYCFDGCGCGGSLHIVLDDDNIADSNIEYCIECACDPEFWVSSDYYSGHDEAGELLGRLLLLMSLTQRGTLARNHSGGNGPADAIERGDFIARCRALLEKYQAVGAVARTDGIVAGIQRA